MLSKHSPLPLPAMKNLACKSIVPRNIGAKQKDIYARQYQKERIAHWNRVAYKFRKSDIWGKYYQRQLAHYYKLFIPPGLRILELGCGFGDLLAALNPSIGVGIDFSKEMVKEASRRYFWLHFIEADVHEISLNGKFDVIIISDLVNDLWDVQAAFERVRALVHPRTRLILNSYSRLWEGPLALTQRLGLSKPNLLQNWLTVEDITNLLRLTGFEVIRHSKEIILPLYLPLISSIANRFLAKIWPFSIAALTHLVIARPQELLKEVESEQKCSVSVIVPARNEVGNIEAIFSRTPEMGCGTEIVFIEGHSKDGTYEAIEQAISQNPNRNCILLKQVGIGKGDAVRLGFANATGQMLMILDADLTVPPEDLKRFYDALVSGKGEIVNGVRLVYPMERQAMRFLNLVGNKFFGLAFSWLLGQSIKDTLCGTKALWKRDYDLIAKNRSHFGDFDPFGDFDLLFGAAKLNLKIVDLPIRYRERQYGETNIDRWRHGLLLFKMLLIAALRIKFI